jgi:hypothetical protein
MVHKRRVVKNVGPTVNFYQVKKIKKNNFHKMATYTA